MKISQLQPGQRVYNVLRRRMGNTTLSSTDVFSIVVKEISPDGRHVMASWNGNPVQRFSEREVSKWKKDKPITVSVGFGASRLATAEEKKLIKAQAAIDAVQNVGENCEKHRRRFLTVDVEGGAKIKYCNDCRVEQGMKPIY